MSDEASFPVFALGRGEVTEFPSLTTMQGYMEAVQVESDEYDAWDACGYAVRLTIATPKAAWLRVSRADTGLSKQLFAELKGESKPYREKELLLRRFAPRFIWEMSRAFAED